MESHSSTLLSSETAQCIRYEEDGSETSTPYDVCLSFCCGEYLSWWIVVALFIFAFGLPDAAT